MEQDHFLLVRGCQILTFCGLVTPPVFVHPVPVAVDAPVWSLAEEEEFRDVVSGYCEKQL